MTSASVRYIVHDVDAAIEFYRDRLGFDVAMHPAPGFAALRKDELSLLLNAPGAGGAGTAGGDPQPGGWSRFRLVVEDLAGTVDTLRREGATFRGDVVEGKGGSQVVLEDPSGNAIELFESNRDTADPVPDGYHTVTPFLLADDVERLLAFIGAAFDGRVHRQMTSDDGVVRHATIKVGSSLLMVSKGTDIHGRVPLMLHLYVEDVDRVYAQALKVGGHSQREPINEFYGDRVAAIKDDWDNQWWIATHVEDVDDDELKQREKAARESL